MIKSYTVRVKTVGYELYSVEAESEVMALTMWDEHEPFQSEVVHAYAVSCTEDE